MLVFLSYVREDFAAVLPLKEGIEKHGIGCFMDAESIAPGEAWEEIIRGAIARCDFFIPCFSEHYSRKPSTWMNREIELALEHHRQKGDRVGWILPVLLSGDIPELPAELDSALRMLNWIRLTPDRWHVTFERLLAVMAPDRPFRGAGIAELARRFSEGRANERIEVLQKLTTVLDLPEAIALLERGLLDPNESVRMQALTLIAQAGEEGAAAAARVIRNPNTSWSFRFSIVIGMTTMRGKAAVAVPAILEAIDTLLSERDETVLPTPVEGAAKELLIREYSRSNAVMFISALGDIGEPVERIRDALTRIRSDAPEVLEAVENVLGKLEL
jgi:hypothetical protein